MVTGSLPNGRRECFEFDGCYYHGFTTCFPDRSKVVRCKYRENRYAMVEKAYVDLKTQMTNGSLSDNKSTTIWKI